MYRGSRHLGKITGPITPPISSNFRRWSAERVGRRGGASGVQSWNVQSGRYKKPARLKYISGLPRTLMETNKQNTFMKGVSPHSKLGIPTKLYNVTFLSLLLPDVSFPLHVNQEPHKDRYCYTWGILYRIPFDCDMIIHIGAALLFFPLWIFLLGQGETVFYCPLFASALFLTDNY
jgi:hypothetical protein